MSHFGLEVRVRVFPHLLEGERLYFYDAEVEARRFGPSDSLPVDDDLVFKMGDFRHVRSIQLSVEKAAKLAGVENVAVMGADSYARAFLLKTVNELATDVENVDRALHEVCEAELARGRLATLGREGMG